MNKIYKICINILLIQSSYAQEISIRFCPAQASKILNIYKDANFLRIGEDKIRQDEGCVDVRTIQKREKLYVRFLKNKYPDLLVRSSADPFNNPQCKLELIKKINRDTEGKKIENRNKQVSLSASELSKNTAFISQLTTFSGKDASIQFDQENLTINCQVTRAGFNITLSSSSPYLSLTNSFFLPPNQFKWAGSVQTEKSKDEKKIGLINNKLETKKKKSSGEIYIRAIK